MDLPEHVKSQWLRLFASRPEVKRAIVFGSRARGDGEPRSDIDLAIEAPQASDKQWLDLWYRLRDESDSLLIVDVLRMEEAPQALRQRILTEGKVLYERCSD